MKAVIFFSGISGSSTADVSAVGSLLIPAMKKAGYRGDESVAIVAAASAMGILVPPCILMVILAAVANGLIPQTDASIGNIQAAATTFGLIQNSNMRDFDSAIANIAWSASFLAKSATLASASSVARSQIQIPDH